jgi:hypothetical protein
MEMCLLADVVDISGKQKKKKRAKKEQEEGK